MILLRLKLNLENNTYIKNGYKNNDYNMLQEPINEVSKIISKR